MTQDLPGFDPARNQCMRAMRYAVFFVNGAALFSAYPTANKDHD